MALFSAIGLFVHAADGQRVPSAGLTSSGVVFLEHNMIANGTVINGTVPFRSVDFPNYWFNANTGELNGNIDFPVNDSLLVVFGDALTLKGNFGAGTGNKLFGIYSLPMRADKATIYYADMYGNVGLYVNNQTVILQPGKDYIYHENETVRDGDGLVRINYEHRYMNHGLIAKSAIQSRMIC